MTASAVATGLGLAVAIGFFGGLLSAWRAFQVAGDCRLAHLKTGRIADGFARQDV